MSGGSLKKYEKRKIIKELKPTKKEAINDFEKLNEITCNNVNPNSRLGNKFIHFFTIMERLETKTRSGKSFFELWEIKNELNKKKYYKKFLQYELDRGGKNDIKLFERFVALYYGSVNVFKSSIAIDIYCRFKPKSILDMTMGWGGRLVGACVMNIPKYTGIDLNLSLRKPYKEMLDILKEYSTTEINLIFKDALKIDYNKLNYDLVLTSPPYYNIELYTGTDKRSEEEWNKNFYEPLFKKSWNGLKVGGHYCLNVPMKVYENVLIPLLGKAKLFIPMSNSKRNVNDYKEYIYVWKKS